MTYKHPMLETVAWVPVEDHLPPENREVMGFTRDKRVRFDIYRFNNTWWVDDDIGMWELVNENTITHWAEQPKGPKT